MFPYRAIKCELNYNMMKKVAVCSNSKCGKSSVVHKIIQWTVENIRAIQAFEPFPQQPKKCQKHAGIAKHFILEAAYWINKTSQLM